MESDRTRYQTLSSPMELEPGADREWFSSSLDYPIATELVNEHIATTTVIFFWHGRCSIVIIGAYTGVGDLRLVIIIILLIVPVIPVIALAQSQRKPDNARFERLDRGKYIVDHVAMCPQCHTARNAAGQLQMNKYLLGAPVPVEAPPFPSGRWAIKAPAIAGLNGYTEEQAVRLLMEGITADDRQPNPPMPRYRMNRRDAEAVAAYLKSLR
jgi:mono/diheme cytochrome c family protein